MPVRNAGRFLAEAVDSVLRQTFRDLELVAVDDGSTDDSLEILQRLATEDPRVSVVTGDARGISAALNRGWHEARGEYIGRLDADDVALPGRLEHQVCF